MKKSKSTEDQIAFPLEQAELGTSVERVHRKMGISEASVIYEIGASESIWFASHRLHKH